MRFAEALPYLEAGRRVRRAAWTMGFLLRVGEEIQWHSGNLAKVDSASLLASDWEVVEEPAPANPACADCGRFRVELTAASATIARLTREREAADAKAAGLAASLNLANRAFEISQSAVGRLTRERDEARASRDDERGGRFQAERLIEDLREDAVRLERELAEARSIVSTLGVDKGEQCFAPTPAGGHRCLMSRGHQGGHQNGAVHW